MPLQRGHWQTCCYNEGCSCCHCMAVPTTYLQAFLADGGEQTLAQGSQSQQQLHPPAPTRTLPPLPPHHPPHHLQHTLAHHCSAAVAQELQCLPHSSEGRRERRVGQGEGALQERRQQLCWLLGPADREAWHVAHGMLHGMLLLCSVCRDTYSHDMCQEPVELGSVIHTLPHHYLHTLPPSPSTYPVHQERH